MKGLLLTLVVLAALLVGADLVAVRVAEGVIASQTQASGGFSQRPAVDVRGFPFLTQALAGRYDDVRVSASGTVSGTPVERLDVALQGVRLPLSQALSGDVATVPVEGLAGDVLLGYRYLSEQAGDGLQVSPAGELLRVKGTVRVLGQTLTATALSAVRLDDQGRVVVRAREVAGVDLSLLGERFDFRVPVDGLPYGLELTGLRVTPAGLALRASSGPTTLSR